MSFQSYLPSKFEYSHENFFFREFSAQLSEIYSGKRGLHVLIGNISSQGHKMDAIFIRSGQISIIDFKDYTGRLEFSENNPWKIYGNNNTLSFVAGGAQGRNPFQQVSAYRYSLIPLLSSNQSQMIPETRTNIKWDHVSCIVLFHREIQFNRDQIPATIQRYFSITDKNSIYPELEDRNSKNLLLNDNEINSILQLLDVRPDNLFNPDTIEIPNQNHDDKIPQKRLEQLRRFIKEGNDQSVIKRVLNYYRALLEIEKFKEPSSDRVHPYNANWSTNESIFKIDLSANAEFFQAYLSNAQERFPKNLFFGVNVLLDTMLLPLFHTIILKADIQDPRVISVNKDLLDIYPKAIASLGLTEDAAEELTTAINQAYTLSQKLETVRAYLNVTAELTQTLSIGLSNESLFTSQLLSELKKISNFSELEIEGGELKSFLLNRGIDHQPPNFNFNPFIQITPLNDSQEKSIRLSFNQPLTVITGPPGTGKSQVVLNIIANAIVNSQSVLFASKNNKAIDSVKERFDILNEDQYLLRFGSAQELQQQTIPRLYQLINHINAGNYLKEETSVNLARDKVKAKTNRIEEINDLVKTVPFLKDQLDIDQLKFEKLKSDYANWKASLNDKAKDIFLYGNEKIFFDINSTNLLVKGLKKLSASFFGRLLFNMFKKDKFLEQFKQLNSIQSTTIQNYINEVSPYIQVSQSLLSTLISNGEFLLQLKKSEQEIKTLNNSFIKQTKSLEEQVEVSKSRYSWLINSRSQFENEIAKIKNELPSLGHEYLNEFIKLKVTKANVAELQMFKNFLPANQIWQEADLQRFKSACESFLKAFSAVCVTSLSIKNSFSLSSNLFDLLVIDEASQCDIASALPLILRAKKVIIIGDPLQLRHITQVKDYEDKYVSESLNLKALNLSYATQSLFAFSYGIANLSTLESIFLKEHFRCHPSIIAFSNLYFYQPILGQTLDIKTQADQFQFQPTGVTWQHVVGQVADSSNINIAEVEKAVNLAQELASKYPSASIGIATPFADQYRAIFAAIPASLRDRIKVDTVHKFQGDEKDIIIFSLVISNGCRASLPRFINEYAPYLLNVGITRARSSLIIVGDYNYCSNLRHGNTPTLLCQLAGYVKALNRVQQ